MCPRRDAIETGTATTTAAVAVADCLASALEGCYYHLLHSGIAIAKNTITPVTARDANYYLYSENLVQA
jgi:hypothetical protein